jgi:aspartate/methionine/tyrosine aminotransferase
MKVIINKADRLWKMPAPVLGNMKFTQRRLAARHVELIDLSSFIPEIPDIGLSEFQQGMPASSELTKASSDDIAALKAKILEKHHTLKSASLDPDKEIIITPGIRMTVLFISLGLLNPGDFAAYPDPGMPYFRSAIALADGVAKKYTLSESNDYTLNILNLSNSTFKKLRLLFINYPHNPTGASVDLYFYRELLKSLRFKNVLTVSDSAHIHPGDPDIASPLQINGGSRMAVELHSFSTTFGIPGLGFAVGHKDVITIIGGFLSTWGYRPEYCNIRLARFLLDRADDVFATQMAILDRRREILSEGLKKLEWHVKTGRQLPFIWAKPPVKGTSVSFSRRLFIKAGIKVSPGTDFGEAGEGWLRLTISQNENKLIEAIERLAQHSKIWQRKYRPEI